MNKYIFEKAKFLGSFDSTHKLGYVKSEVAFVGRSNAGKSSLINALAGSHVLAKTSKTPGKTRTINVFSVHEEKWLIDLPGYGFARVSHKEKGDWKHMIEAYFANRKSLRAIFVIIDAYVGPTALDMQMIDWLKRHGVEFRIIVNKIDQVTQSQLTRQRQELPLSLEIDTSNIVFVSAKKKLGINELYTVVSKILL